MNQIIEGKLRILTDDIRFVTAASSLADNQNRLILSLGGDCHAVVSSIHIEPIDDRGFIVTIELEGPRPESSDDQNDGRPEQE